MFENFLVVASRRVAICLALTLPSGSIEEDVVEQPMSFLSQKSYSTVFGVSPAPGLGDWLNLIVST